MSGITAVETLINNASSTNLKQGLVIILTTCPLFLVRFINVLEVKSDLRGYLGDSVGRLTLDLGSGYDLRILVSGFALSRESA